MFKQALLSLLVISTVFSSQVDTESTLFKKFEEFTHKYQKTYNSQKEFNQRFEIFKRNYIENALSASKGVTQFFDLTEENFKSQYLTTPHKCRHHINKKSPVKDIPSSLDWRTKGGVSPVKNQSASGEAFVFSAVAFLESQSVIRYKKAYSFSERQIEECDHDKDRLMESALLYVQKYGIEKEGDYGNGGNIHEGCKYDKSKVVNYVTDVHCLENPAIEEIKTELNEIGPLAIGISATDLMYYTGGILNCRHNNDMDHGVLLIGYGENYWIIKNSWGTSWGESGFARISSTQGKNCGIGQYVVNAKLVNP